VGAFGSRIAAKTRKGVPLPAEDSHFYFLHGTPVLKACGGGPKARAYQTIGDPAHRNSKPELEMLKTNRHLLLPPTQTRKYNPWNERI
jgi:hypothetical protein